MCLKVFLIYIFFYLVFLCVLGVGEEAIVPQFNILLLPSEPLLNINENIIYLFRREIGTCVSMCMYK